LEILRAKYLHRNAEPGDSDYDYDGEEERRSLFSGRHHGRIDRLCEEAERVLSRSSSCSTLAARGRGGGRSGKENIAERGGHGTLGGGGGGGGRYSDGAKVDVVGEDGYLGGRKGGGSAFKIYETSVLEKPLGPQDRKEIKLGLPRRSEIRYSASLGTGHGRTGSGYRVTEEEEEMPLSHIVDPDAVLLRLRKK
jgi:hypothetical protein